jgi:LuxR family maltose regulon positive regulatory protein
METPLLQTKLYIPPPRPDLVARPRLIERLNEGLPRQNSGFARKLTLVSAPAGSLALTLMVAGLPSSTGPSLLTALMVGLTLVMFTVVLSVSHALNVSHTCMATAWPPGPS